MHEFLITSTGPDSRLRFPTPNEEGSNIALGHSSHEDNYRTKVCRTTTTETSPPATHEPSSLNHRSAVSPRPRPHGPRCCKGVAISETNINRRVYRTGPCISSILHQRLRSGPCIFFTLHLASGPALDPAYATSATLRYVGGCVVGI